MSSIEDDIKAMIPEMTRQVAEQIREEAIKNIKWTTTKAIADEVTKYIGEIVIPQIRADLEANADEIRAAVLSAAQGVAVLIAEHLVSRAKEKLASYEGDKLLNTMLGPLFRGY